MIMAHAAMTADSVRFLRPSIGKGAESVAEGHDAGQQASADGGGTSLGAAHGGGEGRGGQQQGGGSGQ